MNKYQNMNNTFALERFNHRAFHHLAISNCVSDIEIFFKNSPIARKSLKKLRMISVSELRHFFVII